MDIGLFKNDYEFTILPPRIYDAVKYKTETAILPMLTDQETTV